MLATATAIALWLDPANNLPDLPERLHNQSTGDLGAGLLTAIAGAGALLSAGYVIGTIPVLVLRMLTRFFELRHPEAVLSPEFEAKVWLRLGGVPSGMREHFRPFLAAAFDHGLVGNGHRLWLERRWNAFNLGTHSATALALSLVLIHGCKVHPGAMWYCVVVVTMFMFLGAARNAWCDVRAMNDLLAQLPGQAGLPEQSVSRPPTDAD